MPEHRCPECGTRTALHALRKDPAAFLLLALVTIAYLLTCIIEAITQTRKTPPND